MRGNKGWLQEMLDVLKLRVYGGRTLISDEDKEKLRRAKEKTKRLEKLVYAQLGVELAVISGKDVPR